jgi:hypothetical protein
VIWRILSNIDQTNAHTPEYAPNNRLLFRRTARGLQIELKLKYDVATALDRRVDATIEKLVCVR